MNLHIGAVVKVKLRRKAMQPLLAMCEVSHDVGNSHLIMLDKNGCWGCLNCRGGWTCSQLPFCLCSLCQLKWLHGHKGRNWALQTSSFAGRGKADRCGFRLNCRICGRWLIYCASSRSCCQRGRSLQLLWGNDSWGGAGFLLESSLISTSNQECSLRAANWSTTLYPCQV